MYTKNIFTSYLFITIFLALSGCLISKSSKGQQNAQWPFYIAFEDATGARDTMWMVLDTSASAFTPDLEPLLGEVPLDTNNGQFRVWRYFDNELNKTNSYAVNISRLYLEAYIHAENYVLPITARWDSSLFHADVLYEYGDPVNRAYFDNEYFFLQSNSWTHEFELMLDNHAVMPSFWWGSSNHFPLFILITRGLGDPLGTIQNDEAEFSIFPNPATNHILMEFPESVNAVFRIYNSSGMLVKSGAVVGDRKKISLDGFATGLYFVEIQDEKGMLVKKFVMDK